MGSICRAFVMQWISYIYGMKKISLLICLLFSILYSVSGQHYYLYGLNAEGGHNQGTIYSYDPINYRYTYLNDLGNSSGPYGGTLVQDTISGYMYGLTVRGNSFAGTIFRYDPINNIDTILFGFTSCYITGATPYGSPLLAKNGKLYAMNDDASVCHSVFFSFDLGTETFTPLFYFDTANGNQPIYCQLIQATDSRIYGMTLEGGAKNMGVLFRFDPFTNKDTVLLNFDSTNGRLPYSGLIQANNGLLYGFAAAGGKHDQGVFFSFDIHTYKDSIIYQFDGISAHYPEGDAYQASNGKIYGLVPDNSDNVNVFSYDPTTGKDTIILLAHGEAFFLNNNNDLVQDPENGLLYGTTTGGGDSGTGCLFSFDPITLKDTILVNFHTAIGYNPDGRLLVSKTIPNAVQQITNTTNFKLFPNPTTGIFTLAFMGVQDFVPVTIEIYNVLGEKVYSISYQSLANSHQLKTIDLSNQPNGIYFYRVVAENRSLIGEGKVVLLR